MAFNNLDLTSTLGTGLNTTSNPDPNTLATKNPYPTPFVNPLVVSSAWTTQGKKGLFLLGLRDGRGEISLKLHFAPSSGSSTTYSITMWVYNTISNSWAKPANNSTINYTGDAVDYIENPGNDPVFLQVSTLSAGTLSIYFDGSVAQGL